MADLPEWLSSTLASDATGGAGVIASWVTARNPSYEVRGPALTVTVGRDDNSPMRDVAAAAPAPGTILVVGGGSESRTAVLGDLIARELLNAGVVAVVTDAPIRDSRAVEEVGLVVWSRGVTPIASSKEGVGHVGGSTSIGGVVVNDGDLVIADADGVVVWPAADASELLERAEAKQAADDQRAAALSG